MRYIFLAICVFFVTTSSPAWGGSWIYPVNSLRFVNPVERLGGERDGDDEGQSAPIYGYMIGDSHFLFYQGSVDSANLFLARVSRGLDQIRQQKRFKDVSAKVVIHAGSCNTKLGSFDPHAPRQADWILSVTPESRYDQNGGLISESQRILIDVWLSNIQLDGLKISENFIVVR